MTYTKRIVKLAGFATVLFISTAAAAQNKNAESTKLDFKAGQKFQTESTVKSTTSMEMMGQQMDIKADVTVVRQLEIKDKKDKVYNVASTITRMATVMDMMGQNINYDSDKKEDSASDMGKLLKEKINVPTALEMGENGKIIPGKKETAPAAEEAGNMAAMMKSMGVGDDDAILTDDMFITAPKNLKAGDVWNDSIIVEGQKTYRDYTVKSIQGNEAVVTIGGKVLTDKKMENQGMEMNLVMESKITGDLTVDAATGVIKQRTMTVDGSGNIEMMGQQVPMTTKVETTSVTKNL
ncbi:MAG TPA: DUF6263 family protein [Ferruginibacter sp.]|nr:DUF6263 family protein [Ferruginibacter sp.]HPH92516.1 DUF6263 family protein [Ferruginibacter sp.]